MEYRLFHRGGCSHAFPVDYLGDLRLTPAHLGLLLKIHSGDQGALDWAEMYCGPMGARGLAEDLVAWGHLVRVSSDHFPPEYWSQPTYCVYLMVARDGLVKIGISKDPHQRQAQLNQASPGTWLLAFGVARNKVMARDIEQYLHDCFRKHRVSGEWFELPARALAFALQTLVETSSARQYPSPRDCREYLPSYHPHAQD